MFYYPEHGAASRSAAFLTASNTSLTKAVFKKIISNDQISFFTKSFNTLHPCKVLDHNWHVGLLINYLNEIECGRLKRLIINIPPRSLKSMCASVAWPAWLLAKDPSRKIIVASYSRELGLKHSQDCRNIMQSEWYRKTFPDTKLSKFKNTQSKFITTAHGFRFTASVNGTLTGEGADFIVVDDPQTPLQALSAHERQKVISWFEQTLLSRLNDRNSGAIVVVMQRLHSDDLSGYLMKHGNWTLLSIPVITYDDVQYKCADYTYRRKACETLHKVRYSIDAIAQLKEELGEYAFNAQYMQVPVNIDSHFVKKAWFRYFRPEEIKFANVKLYQSWDCAVKSTSHSDYTACSTVCYDGNNYYLLDLFKDKIQYPELKRAIIEHYERYKPEVVFIEDKASGQQIVQELRQNMPIVPITPKYDKLTRFILITPIMESGRLFFPCNALWMHAFEEELLNFPNVTHDDQVDSLTQALHWITNDTNSSTVRKSLSFL